MEQVRLIVAIVLSLLVFVAWDFFFVDKQPPVQPTIPPAEMTERKPAPEAVPELSRRTDAVAVPDRTFKTITVQTGLYTAEISEQGATIKQFVLQEYRESPGAEAPRKVLVSKSNPMGTALVGFAGDSGDPGDKRFTTDFSGEVLRVHNNAESLAFYWQGDDGLVLEKRYSFYPDSYRIGMTVTVINQSDRPVDPELLITMTNPPPDSGRSFSFRGPFMYIDPSIKEIDVDDIAETNEYTGNVKWAGFTGHYFMSALVPENPIETTVRLKLDTDADLLLSTYTQPTEPIPAGSRHQYEYALFFGPKRIPVLTEFGHNLDKAVHFGFFDFIAKPCLWLMNAIHDHVIANYGVAIMLLTLMIKILFWPLGNKSYKSMAEMKKLQPLMADIRKRYKDDKKKMNEEVMRLYRTYKVNPMSGCLPMVAQIPVFIAFYNMLYNAIELRHAPFLLWINDLSAPDRLFQFDLTIPFMAPPFGIPVLTIIMGATMFFQQKLSPPPGDPAQAKFMMMMPLIFTVIFINFPSGLVLYWLVNNVVSIAQQYYITRKTA